MFMSVVAAAFAVQLGAPAVLQRQSDPLLLQSQYRRYGHPQPCGDGYDVDVRDGWCYPNGMVPPRFQAGRQYPRMYGGRQPVPCGNGADVDSRDGLCYPTGTVPRRFQQGRQDDYYARPRRGYY
ncbi:MAG: hypothetical protein JWP25_3201 [Bradyrhizobium sp.]|jgi:hypothetical protein|nr:hypothetical protein [Bradyrhizobium sp.]MEA2868726.1 hypothetical protein [Bradyrhizobium sp.]